MRLIDADELKRECTKLPRVLDDEFVIHVQMKDVTKSINNAPTIEAEPVRHGRCDMCEIMESGHWIRLYNGNGWEVGIGRRIDGYELVISHCGEHFATKIDYCPYCGAKMDGESK